MAPSGVVVPRAVDSVDYSFASEYNGPPVTYDLPRAVPINVDRIPVAAVVTQASLSDKLTLPVVKPIVAPNSKFSKELKLASGSTVSPTSVIEFERRTVVESDRQSKESNFCSDATACTALISSFEGGDVDESECVLSGEHGGSGAIGFSNDYSSTGHDLSTELVTSATNWRSTEFSGSLGKSQDLSGSSSTFRVSNKFKASFDFNDSSRPEGLDWTSIESALSSEYPSSRISSRRAEDCCNPANFDIKRAPIVTFQNIDSDDDDAIDDYNRAEPRVARVKKEPATKTKKGSCYRCFKGNRFTEKEVCIVCDAKYCSNCVLRAMGSMPEGRKCLTCIGYTIDESKRGHLGKCSRLLKRLLNELEVRQIMKAEKICEANQLPPEYIRVNGESLCQEELVLLQSCPNPPKKLKPGNYWYDKVSGLWGKEGQKPFQVISPHLSVGGQMKANASSGNTQVFINGREITKVELRMLQLAGVQCVGSPHFWLNEDGSYQEEGQKNTRGYIWGKAGIKLLCTFLSLPVPSKSSNPSKEQVNNLVHRTVPDYHEQKTLHKLLLVGFNGSGTSTIFKQAKILYKTTPFSEEEHENIRLTIQSNVYGYLGILLEAREQFEDALMAETRRKQYSDESGSVGNTDENEVSTTYSIGQRLKAFSDWLLKTMVSGNLDTIFPAATREYAPLVEELWNDPAIQATYHRRSELEMLPSVSTYFLEKVVDILRVDYEPSDVDILYAEGVISSNGLACVEFSFPQPTPDDDIDNAERPDPFSRYQLIRVQARGFGENCKWIEMFEDVRIVIFCVALSDYDQYTIDEYGAFRNKMLASRKFFESIVCHPTFEQMDFLLLLNKFDLFEEKIERGAPLTRCEWFSEFHPLLSRHRSNINSTSINNNPSLAQLASHYIAVKFKRLYSCLTGRKLYVSLVKGLEPKSVDSALRYAREVLKWNEERDNFSLNEYSIYSTEVSSFSH